MKWSALFQKTSSHWVRYSNYECYEAENGLLYVAPADDAKVTLYDPLTEAESMMLAALNTGKLLMNSDVEDDEKLDAVMDFVSQYGLLGFMTALPTTPKFMEYEAVYLPKNHFIKDEVMDTSEYVSIFFPFQEPMWSKDGIESQWDITDREMIALAMTMSDKPLAVNMCMQREYAERYDWLATVLKDLAFSFFSSFFFYEDGEQMEDDGRELIRQSMIAFGGIAPTYHIDLLDKPTIVWEFHSLLLMLQMVFSFALTDEKKPLRMCMRCQKVFIAKSTSIVFCSKKCKKAQC